jgi:parallel beta-helix repeat protein
MRRLVAMAMVAAVSVVVGVVGTEPMTAVATDGEMVVTENTTLTEDHNGNIVIGADGITLDCDAHTVTGSGSGVGVQLDSRTGVTVRNCHVVQFDVGFEVGAGSSSVDLEGNTADGNGQGFVISGSTAVTLTENEANNNASWGIILTVGTTSSILSKNSASGNEKIGFALNTVSGNELVENRSNGHETNFDLLDSDNNTLEGNVANGGFRGFAVSNSDGNTITNNSVVGTTGGAGFIFGNSSNNVVMGNLAEKNQAQGFTSFTGSQGNTFTSNSSHANTDTGFSDGEPELNTYANNICVGNGALGSDPNGLCDESGSFTDDDGNTFELDIEWMNREGITKGCNPPTNDEFCPDDSVTRGQMAAFLVRALGYTDDGGGDLFTDDDSSVFENDINKLAAAGVTKGCNPPANDQYCPDDFVTRGQMAAFLVRALGYTDDGGGDLFTDDDGNTFEADIDKLGTAGVTKGCNPPANTEYCPNDFVTRGQMAAFLRRALEN